MIRDILARQDERTDKNKRSHICIRNTDALTFGRLEKIEKIKILGKIARQGDYGRKTVVVIRLRMIKHE